MEKGVLTVRELMDFLRVGRKKAYELIHTSGFPSFRVGRKVLINRDGLIRWVQAQEEKRNDHF